MRPVYLEFCGINSFSEPAEIDFSYLLEYGVFGIFGDTGSGKSTVLDCICFALYGEVARINSRASSIADIINYKKDKANVVFEFEIVFEGKRRVFRIERELKRKNAVQSARVWERDGDALLARADGVRESNALLERIIGLEKTDFERCIALPQGEFAQFVKSQRADRLKLVSRLFDLERYGESLTKRANARYAALRTETEVLNARLEPYAEVTDERAEALRAEIAALAEEEKRVSAALAAAREQEKKLSSLAERRAEAERAAERLRILEQDRESMSRLHAELSKAESAKAAVTARREADAAEAASEESERAFSSAQDRLKAAELSLRALPQEDGHADGDIVRLTEQRVLVAASEKERERRREAERRLAEVSEEYRREAEKFRGFRYGEERAALDARISELGEGDFLAYTEARGKEALFREEYATFTGEVTELSRRHPEIAEDAAPIIEKYSALSLGERQDYSEWKRSFAELERARKEARDALVALEQYKGKYDLHLQRMEQLQTEYRRLKEETSGGEGEPQVSLAELDRRLEGLKRERALCIERRKNAEAELSAATATLAAASERKKAASENGTAARERLQTALRAGGFSDAAEAEALLRRCGDADRARARVEAYREQYAAVRARVRELSAYDFSEATDERLEAARRELSEAEERAGECAKRLALCRADAARTEKDLQTKRGLEAERAKKREEAERSERLKKLLEGNKFMEFVAEEYLQTVAGNASGRLLSLTGGRYFLRYDGGFVVGDNFNGGQERGVYTLSGGETFLVSLSLALALSEEICLKSLRPIEFFFLDEGFGTLDERLVDTVMDSLEQLKGEHFSIGIISHVEELKHRIDRKLLVKKATEKRGSQIQAE